MGSARRASLGSIWPALPRKSPSRCGRCSSTGSGSRCARPPSRCRRPLPASCCCACRRARSAAPTCTCSTARSLVPSPPRILGHQIVGTVLASDGAGEARGGRRAARRRAVARLDLRRVRVLHERPREPVPARAVHRPGHRRRHGRVHRRGRPLLLPDPRRVPERAGGAADVRGPDRLPRAAHVRAAEEPRHLRLRSGRAHHHPGRDRHRGCASSPSRAAATRPRRRSRWSSAPSGPGTPRGRRRSRFRRRSSSRPSASSCRSRCARARPAGRSSAAAST